MYLFEVITGCALNNHKIRMWFVLLIFHLQELEGKKKGHRIIKENWFTISYVYIISMSRFSFLLTFLFFCVLYSFIHFVSFLQVKYKWYLYIFGTPTKLIKMLEKIMGFHYIMLISFYLLFYNFAVYIHYLLLIIIIMVNKAVLFI